MTRVAAKIGHAMVIASTFGLALGVAWENERLAQAALCLILLGLGVLLFVLLFSDEPLD